MRRVTTGLNRVLYVLYHGLFAITCIALAYKGKGSREASQLLIFYEYPVLIYLEEPERRVGFEGPYYEISSRH